MLGRVCSRARLLCLPSTVGLQQLLQRAGEIAQHAGGALKLLVQDPVRLPVHCSAQIVRQLKGILCDTPSALATAVTGLCNELSV